MCLQLLAVRPYGVTLLVSIMTLETTVLLLSKYHVKKGLLMTAFSIV